MRFCVIRHPDLPNLGTSPESALEIHQAKGWVRVSEWRDRPDAFHLPEFAEAVEDLDAEPEAPAKPKKPAKPEAASTTTEETPA